MEGAGLPAGTLGPPASLLWGPRQGLSLLGLASPWRGLETWEVAEKAAVGVKAKVAAWPLTGDMPPGTEGGLAWPCVFPRLQVARRGVRGDALWPRPPLSSAPAKEVSRSFLTPDPLTRLPRRQPVTMATDSQRRLPWAQRLPFPPRSQCTSKDAQRVPSWGTAPVVRGSAPHSVL